MLKVGPLQLSSNLLLAPIAGYCDLAFRTVCRELAQPEAGSPHGCGLGLACTDLLSPQGLLRGTATSLDLAQTSDFDKPIGMQLYGGDPEILADGARWARDHGASLIDINMGCPVDKVTKKDGGSKLLCIPDVAEKIVEAVMRAVGPSSMGGSAGTGIPVTAKMRLGWFDDQPVAKFLAPKLVSAGAAMITIHGRTTQQKFTGTVRHEGIAEVVAAVKSRHPMIPVIGNGDVTEPQHVVEMIRRTGCDGVMIGRGALSKPWIFRDAWALQTTGEVPDAPTREEIIAIARRYFALMLHYRDEYYAMHHIRRRVSWFAKPLSVWGYTKGLKEAIRTAKGPAEVEDAFARYLENPALLAHAGAAESDDRAADDSDAN